MSEPNGARTSHAVSSTGPTRISLSIERSCSNACVFCAYDGTVDGASEAELASLVAHGAQSVTLGGGEPTLAPEALEAAIVRAKQAGFHDVIVQTNGHHLAPVAARLASLGLRTVHVSVHGPNAAAHDYHTGREGSFDALWAGVGASLDRKSVV